MYPLSCLIHTVFPKPPLSLARFAHSSGNPSAAVITVPFAAA